MPLQTLLTLFGNYRPADAGALTAAAALFLVLIAGMVWCAIVSRRPSANARSMVGLMLVLAGYALLSLVVLVMAPRWPRAWPAQFAMAMTAFVLVLLGAFLGMSGYAEIRRTPSRFREARIAAITSAILAICFTAAVTWRLYEALTPADDRPQQLAQSPATQPAAIAIVNKGGAPAIALPAADGEWVLFEEQNLRFRAPQTAWTRTADAPWAPDSRFSMTRSEPAMLFSIRSSTPGVEAAGTTDALATQVLAGLQTHGEPRKLIEQRRHTIDGLDGILMMYEGQLGAARLLWLEWICSHQGHVYNMMLAGPSDQPAGVREAAMTMFGRFQILSRIRVAHGPLVPPLPPFRSSRYGYTVQLPPGWMRWPTLHSDVPGAEFGARWGVNTCFAVFPVNLLGHDADADTVTAGLSELMSIPFSKVTGLKQVKENGAEGHRCQYSGISSGIEYTYSLRTVRRGSMAYLLAGWTSDPAHQSVIEKTLESFTLLPATPAFTPATMTRQEKRTHALFFNGMGLRALAQQQPAKAISLFQMSLSLRPDAAGLENLVQACIDAGQFRLAELTLDQGILSYPEHAGLRARQAWLLAELGKPAQAIAIYQKLFRSGYDEYNYFNHYMSVLVKEKRTEAAVAEAALYARRTDSVAATVLLSQLHAVGGEYAKAIAVLKEHHARVPYNAALVSAIIEQHLNAEQYTEALALAKQLIEWGNDSANSHFLRGRAEFGLEWYPDAKESLEAALKRDPANASIAEYLKHASAALGEGDNASIKEPIEPVAVPDDLLKPPATDAPAGEHSAWYVNRVTAIAFEPGRRLASTEYRCLKVLDTNGVETFSTLRFSFEPLLERLYVNRLEVKDEHGKTVSTGKIGDYYIFDDSKGDVAANTRTLHVPVPGLKPGYTIESVLSRQDVRPPEKMRYMNQSLSAGFPVARAAVVFQGDASAIRHRGTQGLSPEPRDGVLVWTVQWPQVLRSETMSQPFARFTPTVHLASAKDEWAAEGREYIEMIADRLAPDPQVEALARRITESTADPEARLAAILRHMQKEYTYKAIEFGRRARIPYKAADIVQKRYGDCKDHALLLHHLLRASGIPSHLALVRASEPIMPDLPTADQFNHMIVAMPGGPGWRFLDCTDKSTDLSCGVPYGLAGQHVLVLDPAKVELVQVPEYPAGSSEVRSERAITVSAGGDVSVRETITLSGYYASSMRSFLRSAEPKQRDSAIQDMVRARAADAEVGPISIEDAEDVARPVVLRVPYSLRNRLHAVGDQLVGAVPAVFEHSYLLPGRVEKRETPFEVELPFRFVSLATFALPPGHRLAAVPTPPALDSGKMSFELKEDQLFMRFECNVAAGRYPASEYEGFWQSRQKMLAAIEQNLVIRRTGP